MQYLMELHRFRPHPTSSPVSFGPSTPVQSASAAPARLLSSPGGMSDVAGTLTPPGLPLRDPRVTGSYGIPLSDPVFGSSSGSLPCENPGQRPIPPPAPLQPAGSAGSARSTRSLCPDHAITIGNEYANDADG